VQAISIDKTDAPCFTRTVMTRRLLLSASYLSSANAEGELV